MSLQLTSKDSVIAQHCPPTHPIISPPLRQLSPFLCHLSTLQRAFVLAPISLQCPPPDVSGPFLTLASGFSCSQMSLSLVTLSTMTSSTPIFILLSKLCFLPSSTYLPMPFIYYLFSSKHRQYSVLCSLLHPKHSIQHLTQNRSLRNVC